MKPIVIILIVVVAIIVIQVVRMGMRSSSHHFECPECGQAFQVSFGHYMFTAHSLDGSCRVTCPKCGKTHLLHPLKGAVPGGPKR